MSRIDSRLVILFFGLFVFIVVTFFYVNNNNRQLSFIDRSGIINAVKEGVNKIQENLPSQLLPSKREYLSQQEIYESLLKNPNDVVLKYVPLPFDYRYGSNLIPLTVAALLSDGPLLELGMGKFSTPLLHVIGADQGRNVVSLETDQAWMLKFKEYNSTQFHKIYHFSDIATMSRYGLNQEWGMVLVDHIHATQRPLDVIKYANISKIVVAHDTEKANEFIYNYEKNKISSYFSYKCKFSLYDTPQKTFYLSTSIFSNYIDLGFLENLFKKINTEFGYVACDYSMK